MTQSTHDLNQPASLPALPTSASILLVGFGAGSLSLVVLRWLGLTGLPTVVFLILLLVGMPVGGVLLIRVRRLKEAGFAKIIAFFCLISLLCVPLLMGLLLGLSPPSFGPEKLIELMDGGPPPPIQFPLASLALFPLFVGYGIVEFAAYRAGLDALRQRSGAVYALNLTGLVVAFIVHRLLLEALATTGLFFLAIVSLVVAMLLLTPRRWLTASGLVLASSFLLLPGLEPLLLSALRFDPGPVSLNYWKPRADRVLCDQWTPHCRLTMLEQGSAVFGFYNGIYYWAYFRGLPGPEEDPARYRRLDMAFTHLVRPGDKVAVIGAGGGVHVQAALRAGAGRVVAVDVVPEMLQQISGPLASHFEEVYSDPRVELVGKNGRRFLVESDETFDVILLARLCSHVTGLRDMLEPSQLMFTREAFQSVRPRLKPEGVLLVTDSLGLDKHAITFRQNYRELRRQQYHVMGYLDEEPWRELLAAFKGEDEPMPPGAYLLVAQADKGQRDAVAIIDERLEGSTAKRFDEPPPAVVPSPDYTDDQAFATGILIANLGWSVVIGFIVFLAVVLAIVGVVLTLMLRSTLSREGQGRRPWLSAASAVVGFNFMGLEYLMVYRWMHHLDITLDATFIGMIVFAGLAAAGGLLLEKFPGRFLVALNVLAAAGLVATVGAGPPFGLLAVVFASFASGALFPRLLRGPDTTLVRVYVWDAYGTLWGGLAALCLPLFFGFSIHQLVSSALLVAAVLLVYRTLPAANNKVPSTA